MKYLILQNQNSPLGEFDIYVFNGKYYLYSVSDQSLFPAGNSLQEARIFTLLKFYELLDEINRSRLK